MEIHYRNFKGLLKKFLGIAKILKIFDKEFLRIKKKKFKGFS